MLRFGRAASLVAVLAVGVIAACGSSDAGGTGGTSGSIGGSSSGAIGDGGSGVGPGGKLIASDSRSCTGGPGADKQCGGVDGDDTKLGTTDCCESRYVPGGSFNRYNDPDFPATVGEFYLDTFLVTAGRIRTWVKSVNGNIASIAPAVGAGANPRIPNSGWRAEWNRFLPTSMDDVTTMFGPEGDPGGFLACQVGTDPTDYGAMTWFNDDVNSTVQDANKKNPAVLAENTQDALDRKPINCIPWHVLFAFCIWDGGRLPTDAEMQFASLGGSEQRDFPWGTVPKSDEAQVFATRPDLEAHAPLFDYGKKYMNARLWDKTIGDGSNTFEDNYGMTWGDHIFNVSDNAAHIMPVGRRPAGNGKYGQADLAGGMFEWMLDEGPINPGPCNNCANVGFPAPADHDPNAYDQQPEFHNDEVGGQDWFAGGVRSIHGGAWDNAVFMSNTQSKTEIQYYTSYPVLRTYRALGGRCARDLSTH